jgi:hypothetical protein
MDGFFTSPEFFGTLAGAIASILFALLAALFGAGGLF